MTKAEAAVDYILGRVITDRNFSWLMWGTEAMAKCLAAQAERKGITRPQLEKLLVAASHEVNERLVRSEQPVEAEVVTARKRIDRIDDYLGHLRDRGGIDDAAYTHLCDLIHRQPEDWPAPVEAF